MNRRNFIKTSGALAAGYSLFGVSAVSAAQQNPYSFITLMQSPLKYELDELEPSISKEIMSLHYTKHAAGYLRKLKGFLDENSISQPLFELIQSNMTSSFLVNNLGGHFNHEIFWRSMTAPTKTPFSTSFLKKVETDFGSVLKMKEEFDKAAGSVFGSGWAWLCLEPKQKKLIILTSANQNNPLMKSEKTFAYPLIGIDVWEHAYYLQYQNRRAEYISAFENIIDWSFADTMYHKVAAWIK